MADIKTVTLTGDEVRVTIGRRNCRISNLGSETIYASVQPGIVPEADGVLSILSGSADKLVNTDGHIYIKGTGKVLLVGSDYADGNLGGVAGNGNIDAAVAEAVAKIVAGAPADFDTLKEISDWIYTHADSAAAMNSDIQTLKTSKADKTEIPTSLPADGGNSATVNNHTVNSDVPSNAKFTDTTYDEATSSTPGLMSGDDKSKLDSAVQTIRVNGVAQTKTNEIVDISIESSGGSADQLSTPRNITTDLASSSAAAFDGTEDITPGVTGVLPIANGGTGNSTGYVTAGQKSGTTLGKNATAEGVNTTASGDYSHAEGVRTIASGAYSHAEGEATTASGDLSHTEGYQTTASGNRSHAEGWITTASKHASHAEGESTTASGDYSHAEGYYSHAEGAGSHAEGSATTASGFFSHTEGYQTTASGNYSHAEGKSTHAEGVESHAEGEATTASGLFSHAEGTRTIASGNYSHAGGNTTVANTSCNYTIGQRNKYDESREASFRGDFFVVGNGTSTDARSNAFRVHSDSTVYGGTYNSSGADYAEYFEWFDGNMNNDDRRGRFVTLHGNKIWLANSSDDFILGIVSGQPSVIGDAHDDQWKQMYLTDIFGTPIFEDVEVPDEIDEDGNVIDPAHLEHRMKLNPNYDNNRKYISRSKRPEWAAIGMMGKLVVVDDGTCNIDGWCAPLAIGIGTKSKTRTHYRVMERLDDTHIRVLVL